MHAFKKSIASWVFLTNTEKKDKQFSGNSKLKNVSLLSFRGLFFNQTVVSLVFVGAETKEEFSHKRCGSL